MLRSVGLSHASSSHIVGAIRALLTISVPLLLVACNGKPCPVNVPFGESELPLATLGEPYVGRVGSMLPTFCSSTLPTVRGTVLDEHNVEVASTWEIDETEPGEATVTFTPTTEGPYYFVAEFNPSIARAQGSIFVALRSGQVPVAELPFPSEATVGCNHLFPSGALACADQTSVLIVVDGGVSQRFSERALFFYAGPVLWLWNGGRELQRWIEQDGRLTLAQRASDVDELAAASESVAFTVKPIGGDVVRYTIDGGSFDRQSFPVPIVGLNGGAFTSDGGAWWSAGNDVCLNPVELDGGQRCFGRSLNGVGRPERHGVWSTDYTRTALRSEDGLERIGTVPGATADMPLISLGAYGSLSEFVLLVPRDDTQLRAVRLNGQYTRGVVDGDWALLQSPGHVFVFRR